MSRKNGVALPTDDAAFTSIEALEQRYTEFSDLQDFLNYYYLAMSTLLHASDFEALMVQYLERAAGEQGLMHAEVFFDPQAHTARGVVLEEVVSGLRAGIRRAQKTMDVSVSLVMCFLRHLPEQAAIETFHQAQHENHFTLQRPSAADAVEQGHENEEEEEENRGGIVVGIGLDSAELPFPPALFEGLFREARGAGLYRTAHAGEEGPASYIATSLDVLHVQRIDHGIRLIEDETLMARVARDGTLLTVCPLSNVRLRAAKSVAHVPIRKLLEAGVKFSINSDDPAYFGGYILENYIAVQDAHALTMQEWSTIAKNAIEGSWCARARKDAMLRKLEQVIAQFTTP